MITKDWELKNESTNHPLRYVSNTSKINIGQFYNSCDGEYHFAEYIPYEVNPRKYLCGKTGNFSPSRREAQDKRCATCLKILERLTSHE